MTEYKVGQKVLVRGEIQWVDHSGKQFIISIAKHGSYTLIDQIYSLAPEFNVGELVEFSNNTVDWYSRCFGAYVPTLFQHPHFSIDGCSYRYARKLQPKDEPVTAEEIYDYVEKHPNKDLIDNLVEHFKGRRIGGGK